MKVIECETEREKRRRKKAKRTIVKKDLEFL